MNKRVLFVVCSGLLCCLTQQNAQAVEDRGQKLYMSHCSKCHTNGMNNVVPSKPVIGSSYLATFATFKSYLDKPVGTMPHYSHLITDQDALKDLYNYVKSMDDSAAKEKEKKDKDKTSQSAPAAKSKEKKAESSSSSEAISEKKALKMLNEKADNNKVENQKKKSKSKAKKKKWSWWPF